MVASPSLTETLQELGEFIRQELAATQVAIGCLRAVASHLRAEVERSGDANSTRLLGAGTAESGFIPVVHGLRGALALESEVAEGGPTHARLTQQWIVTVFTAWEEEFRPRIETAHGVERGALKLGYFGDLRLLRNDVVHHLGRASKDESVKCTTLLRRTLKPGDLIYLKDEELLNAFCMVPWQDLETGPHPDRQGTNNDPR